VNRKVKAVAFWIVMLIAGILMWKVVQASDTSKMQELSFSEFMQDVDRGGVSQVTLAGNDVHGKLKNGNSAFHTKVPEAVYADVLRELRTNGVNIVVTDASSSGWTLILNLSPLILFAALWYFMIRQMRGRRIAAAAGAWRPSTDKPPLSAVEQGGGSWKQSPRLLLANAAGAMTFGTCRSQGGEITFHPESQIGPITAWMLAPIPPAELSREEQHS
jgi:hypothetical protein